MTDEAPSEQEKTALWRQRFFEAQAACEQYLMERDGPAGISDWIEKNSAITAHLLSVQESRSDRRLAHFVRRLAMQLCCYDSELRVEKTGTGFVLSNFRCGILSYRRQAQRNGVTLTFKSPCEYCQSLNAQIARKYLPVISISIRQLSDGCSWQLGEDAANTNGRVASSATDVHG